jgi:hypothetical protein
LRSVPNTVDCPAPLAPPVIVAVYVGIFHLYVVPIGTIPFAPLVGVTRNNTPLQVTALIAVITGVGFR